MGTCKKEASDFSVIRLFHCHQMSSQPAEYLTSVCVISLESSGCVWLAGGQENMNLTQNQRGDNAGDEYLDQSSSVCSACCCSSSGGVRPCRARQWIWGCTQVEVSLSRAGNSAQVALRSDSIIESSELHPCAILLPRSCCSYCRR